MLSASQFDYGARDARIQSAPVQYRNMHIVTLADYERAMRVALHDAESTRTRILARLAQLRELDVRGRALLRVAPLPATFD